MATYADYTFYTGTYLGSAIAEAEFNRLALRASFFVDQVTFDRAAAVVEDAEDADTIEKIGMATCSIAEELQKLDAGLGTVFGGAVKYESIGWHSVSYANPPCAHTRIIEAAKLYLGSSGLMYAGLAEGE